MCKQHSCNDDDGDYDDDGNNDDYDDIDDSVYLSLVHWSPLKSPAQE